MIATSWIIAVIVALVVAIAGYMYWQKKHPHPQVSSFQPMSAPSAQMSQMHHRKHLRPVKKQSAPAQEGFGGMDWPDAGTFGAMADTYPYGNYADGLQMYYPTYDEYAALWTRS